MAASSDDSEDDNFVVLGTAVPELAEGEAHKKPTTVQDLTARDKQGRRRFHGAFTGGFSAGYFNTVGTKEGFTPSSFVSSRSQKNEESSGRRPEDFMDEEDLEEHGIAPRKFATVANYTSEERKRKLNEDSKQLSATGHVDLAPALTDLVIPEQLPIGIKLLRKMGWREGQGLGPRVKKKKKKKTKQESTKKPNPALKVYGCPLPPSDQDDSDSDSFVPENMSNITFAPRDVCPIPLDAKDNVHGLGYRGLDPSLALPSSHINLFDTASVRSRSGGKGIQGQAFGVGAFEEEDEDIYTVDNMSNYDITMQPDDDEADSKFGWTAPRKHGKQAVPVSYVGKLLEGFTLSSHPLAAKKKFPPPVLPPNFRPQHWFRKRREVSHLPASLTEDGHGASQKGNITAVDRGLLLGETPVIDSVFDLIPKEEKSRIEATKQAIAIQQSLVSKVGKDLTSRFQPANESSAETNTRAPAVSSSGLSDSANITNTFLAKFKPADVTHVEPSGGDKTPSAPGSTPLFQGSLSFQPFRKDAVKQARYDTYLASLKQGISDPYSAIGSSHLTEWEKARERDEFSKAAKIFRPMSALMSSRFVRGAMIDDKPEAPVDTENEKSDQMKAAEMKMFGKLTREEFEWHPDKLLCRRFNVPNPYPGSDLVGLPTVKRDKYSVFNFLNFGDYQSGEFQEPPTIKPQLALEPKERTLKSVQSRKATMASIFKVLDDPDFHKPAVKTTAESKEKVLVQEDSGQSDKSKGANENDSPPDKDLFRAIFKNSDSESSSDESADEKNDEAADKEGNNTVSMEGTSRITQTDSLARENIAQTDSSARENIAQSDSSARENIFSPATMASTLPAVADSRVVSGRSWSQGRGKSVFSVLDDLKHEPDDGYQEKTDGHIQTENISSRLSPPANGDDSGAEYGPSLPPASTSTGSVSLKHTSHTESEKIDKTENARDKRHRHRKEKKKKSKHKKEKKHKKHRKSSKSRKAHKEESCSGSEADTEDSDVSDSELLRRLKEVSKGTTKLWKHI
ncbi:hypothetical protein BsWGS_15901 [Bradybaena similaris]